MAAQLLAVGWAFLFAGAGWAGRLHLLLLLALVLGEPAARFHEAGLARLERAGLRAPTGGEVAGGISSSACRTSQPSS